MHEFLQTETKLIGTWVGAGILSILSRFGLPDYELWKVLVLDILTGISLIVVIGYTLARWMRLVKDSKKKKTK